MKPILLIANRMLAAPGDRVKTYDMFKNDFVFGTLYFTGNNANDWRSWSVRYDDGEEYLVLDPLQLYLPEEVPQ